MEYAPGRDMTPLGVLVADVCVGAGVVVVALVFNEDVGCGGGRAPELVLLLLLGLRR
jgi:hypothetical protein